MKHISKFCAAGNNIVTPMNTVNVLRGYVSINNSIAKMIYINQRMVYTFLIINPAIIKRL